MGDASVFWLGIRNRDLKIDMEHLSWSEKKLFTFYEKMQIYTFFILLFLFYIFIYTYIYSFNCYLLI